MAPITVGADGGFSVTVNNLRDGTHAFTVVASDALGNASARVSGAADLVDTTAPTLNTLVQSVTNAWTKVTSDTITVSASDSGSGVKNVQIYDNGTYLANATQSGGGWTYTAAGLTGGAHTFTALATDNAGNASTSTLSAVDQIEAVPPLVRAPVLAPGNGGYINQTSSTITLSVVDAGAGVKSVEIFDYVNGSLTSNDLGAATLTSSGWTFTATSLAQGAHRFTGVATDGAGNKSSESALGTLTVDLTAPVIGGLSQSVTDAWTKTLSDTITVTASDSGSGVKSVEVYQNGKDVGGAMLTSGAWTYTASNLAYGANTFTAVATDNAGNTSTSTLNVVDQIDRTAPVIGGISQSGSSTAWIKMTSDTITVSASDSGSGVKSVEIYDGSKDLGAATPSSGAWTYTASNLADGVHTFTAFATDNAGNASKSSVIDRVDHTAPILASIIQSASAAWNSATSDKLTISARDLASGVKSVEFYDGTKDRGAATLIGAGPINTNGVAQWTYTATNLADGTHTFTAVATDNAGNTVTSSAVVDRVDHTLPSVANLVQAVSSGWTTDTAFNLTLKISDATSGVKSVEVLDNGTSLGAATSLADGEWIYTATDLADGMHNFTAKVTDNAGNITTSKAVTDYVGEGSTPILGPIVETRNGTDGDFRFQVKSKLADAAGAPIQNIRYWIDQVAAETMAPNNASSAGAMSLNRSGVGTDIITVNASGDVGSYLHIQALDTLGTASTIGTVKIK